MQLYEEIYMLTNAPKKQDEKHFFHMHTTVKDNRNMAKKISLHQQPGTGVAFITTTKSKIPPVSN